MTFAAPFAGALCSVGGGTPTAGGQVLSSTATPLQFSDVTGGNFTTALYEIYDYPPGYSTPAGWTFNALSGAFFYNATSAAPNPPPVTIQSWGKLALRLTVNGGLDPTGKSNPARMVDATCALTMASPHGLWDLFFGEAGVFGGFRQWVGDHKKNLRTIEAALNSVGAGTFTSPAPPQLFTAAGTIVFSGAIQAVGIDTSAAGSYNIHVPAGTDGQMLEVDDHNGTWVAHGAPGLIVPNAVWIENPIGSQVVLGNVGGTNVLTLPATSGVPRTSLRWKFYANTTTHPTWKLS